MPACAEPMDCGKTRYSDKKAAVSAANLRMRHRKGHREMRRGKVKSLRAYDYPDCGGWHLTSKPKYTHLNP